MAVRPFVLCLLAVAARVISVKPEVIKKVCTEEKLVEFSPGAFVHLDAHGLSSRHTATVWTKHTWDEDYCCLGDACEEEHCLNKNKFFVTFDKKIDYKVTVEFNSTKEDDELNIYVREGGTPNGKELAHCLLHANAGPNDRMSVETTSFAFFPDRDRNGIFTIRIPREAVSPKEADSVHIRIRNDQGSICAEKTCRRDLEIKGLPCDQCLQGDLHVTIEPRNQSRILSTTEKMVSDESRRAEICSLRPEHRREGENIKITTIKQLQDGGCRWVFRDESGYVSCCFSNRDFYSQSGGCNPFMQSPVCRKGSELPSIKEDSNSCIIHISNLDVKDSGNYLSNYDEETPTFKINLVVNPRPKIVSGPRNISVPVGQELLELECGIQAASGDDPKVIWRKDGEELGEFGFQNMERMALARNNNSLLIYNITSTDLGNYTCTLKVGAFEIDSQTGQVAVIDIQVIEEWKLVLCLALTTTFTFTLLLISRAHRLRQSGIVVSSKEEGAGDPLDPASGEEEGEERMLKREGARRVISSKKGLVITTLVLAIISILTSLPLIAISSIELSEVLREFETSHSEESAASLPRLRRGPTAYTIRILVLATQVAAGSLMLLASIISSALTCTSLCCRPGRGRGRERGRGETSSLDISLLPLVKHLVGNAMSKVTV